MSELKLEQINKSFGKKTILSNINLSFSENKIYGLLGRNGAGKSTLLNIIVNRIFADSGMVRIDGENINDNDRKLDLMYLMSEVDLYANGDKLSKILENTEKLYGGFNWELSEKLANKFEINLDQKYGKLSTGYHSIFKLIIALCVPVKFVILDEPILGLDANHRDLFYSELLQSYSDNPRTFIISTHLIEEVTNIISDVVILDNSRILLAAPVEEILDQAYGIVGPQNEVDDYTKGLNIIGTDKMGNLKTTYVYGNLNDNPVPDTVQISNLDLQKLFVLLTSKNGGNN